MQFSKSFHIGQKRVGDNSPVFIIAEAGLSHFGDEGKAYKLVDLAADAGADAVKFQIFDVDQMISNELSDWKKRLSSRSLDYEAFLRIRNYCNVKNIIFFATPHDKKSLSFLNEINLPVIKIGSGEVGNLSFYKQAASYNKPIIFSVGMFHHKQVEEVLNIFQTEKNSNIALLHCVTDYPASYSDISLENIKYLNKKFNVITGYSDHTKGFHIPLASIAMGAKIIEKHITLDYFVPNAQDWKVSCGPSNFKKFVKQVRDIEKALTLRLDGPTEREKINSLWAKKSLVSSKDLLKGHLIVKQDLMEKRAGNGISPSNINFVLGKRLKRNIKMDSIIKFEDLI